MCIRDSNWDVTVIPVTPAFQLAEKYDTYMLKNGFCGAFLVGFALHDEWMKQLEQTTMPTVLFDNYIKKNPNVAYIGTDNYEGIDAAVDHLYTCLLYTSIHRCRITAGQQVDNVEVIDISGKLCNEVWCHDK